MAARTKKRLRTTSKMRKRKKSVAKAQTSLDYLGILLKWRGFTLGTVVIGIIVVIVLRLYSLQVFAYEDYRALATNQHQVIRGLIPERGEVFLKNKADYYPLAINREYKMAYAVPRDIENVDGTARDVAAILDLPEDIVRAKLSKSEDLFEILKHRISDAEQEALRQRDFAGIKLQPQTFRYYPSGPLASHTIGFVGSDGETESGRYGIEAAWEKTLSGEPGNLLHERDARGTWIGVADRLFTPAQDGEDLVLTMEYAVQFEVEKILRETVEKHEADSGAIVVMEPSTGKILALANYPTFNPNEFGSVEDANVFVNSVVSQPYESGSIFKPITMAIGLDQGKVTPDTTYTDTGVIYADGFPLRNSEDKVYDLQTMTQVLEESINTGVIHVEQLVGHTLFADYVKRFGFGQKVGVALPLDVGGNILNLKNTHRNVEFFTASFGQGITTTPLQMASAYCALANGGELMTPQIIEKRIASDGTEHLVDPAVMRRVISEETSQTIGEMLESVVVNGHGKRAGVPGYRVGGKTGTAQVARSDARGYDEERTIGSFAGYAPIQDPRFVIVVKIENPKDVIFAESTAAPAFGRVMAYLLKHYEIEPTEPIERKERPTTNPVKPDLQSGNGAGNSGDNEDQEVADDKKEDDE